jgi:hypothetical protein
VKKFDGTNKIKRSNRVLKSNLTVLIYFNSKNFQLLIRLIGNAILITAFLSYCGPFNQEFRQRMLNDWQKQIQQRIIPFSDNFNIIEQLNDEATVRQNYPKT